MDTWQKFHIFVLVPTVDFAAWNLLCDANRCTLSPLEQAGEGRRGLSAGTQDGSSPPHSPWESGDVAPKDGQEVCRLADPLSWYINWCNVWLPFQAAFTDLNWNHLHDIHIHIVIFCSMFPIKRDMAFSYNLNYGACGHVCSPRNARINLEIKIKFSHAHTAVEKTVY